MKELFQSSGELVRPKDKEMAAATATFFSALSACDAVVDLLSIGSAPTPETLDRLELQFGVSVALTIGFATLTRGLISGHTQEVNNSELKT